MPSTRGDTGYNPTVVLGRFVRLGRRLDRTRSYRVNQSIVELFRAGRSARVRRRAGWLATILGLTIAGCGGSRPAISGSGVAAREARPIEGVRVVRVEIPAAVEISVGKAGPAEIETDDNLLPLLETVVQGEELILRFAQDCTPRTPLRVRLPLKHLDALSAAGAGKTSATGITGESLEVEVSGVADVELAGQVSDVRIRLSGTGTVNAARLAAETANITLTGTGNIDVNARQRVDVFLTGTGTVSYTGNPVLNSQVTGTGKVQRRGT